MKGAIVGLTVVSAWNLRHVDQGTNVVDAEESLGNIWVPVTLPQQATKYLNPVTGEKRAAAPAGAVVTKAAEVTGYKGGPTYGDGIAYGAPGEQFLPDDVRKSCVPHCTWNCTQPVCEEDCEPVCKAGDCETRCPKMDKDQLESCHINCGEPVCSMYCPKDDLCGGKKTLDCETRPKCKTRCEEPKCGFVCNNDLGDRCKTVCPDPVCTFKCKKPKACPNPHCNMVCEKPPECDTRPNTLAPPKDGETVVGEGKAQSGVAGWAHGDWGTCSTTCGTGTQIRNVYCNTKHSEDCAESAKPEATRSCEGYAGCEYGTSPWSTCNARCGKGTQTRRVSCAGKQCYGNAPATQQVCEHDDPECRDCRAVVFGGPSFDGWTLEFPPGEYSVADMEAKGAKCDDISSMKVYGIYCRTTVYEFGDFNQQHNGWSATFGPGMYDREGLVKGGAKDNDISSLKVVKNQAFGANFTSGGFNATNPMGNGSNPFGNGSNPFNASNPLNPFRSGSSMAAAMVAIALPMIFLA